MCQNEENMDKYEQVNVMIPTGLHSQIRCKLKLWRKQ